MKYRLKKDLPFVKAGDDKVNIENHSLNSEFIVSYTDANGKFYTCIVPINNAHLWIEEIKPREFEIILFADGSIAEYIKGEYIINKMQEIIKVTENL